MPLYQRIPESVHAEQWQPGIELPGVEKRWVAAVKIGPYKHKKFQTATVWTLAGDYRLSPGDWILYHKDGSRMVVPNDLFQAAFRVYRRERNGCKARTTSPAKMVRGPSSRVKACSRR